MSDQDAAAAQAAAITAAVASAEQGFKTRLDAVAAKRDAETARADAAGAALEAQTAAGATVGEQLAAITAERDAAVSGRAEDMQLVGLGISNPEAIAVARMMHGNMPEDVRGTLVDFMGTQMADPADAPGWLKGYLAQPVAPVDPAAVPPATPKPPGIPNSNGGVVPTPPTVGELDVANLSDDEFRAAQKDGRLSKYLANLVPNA